MIECSFCKSVNQSGSAFCAECGRRLGPGINTPPKLHSPLLDEHGSGESNQINPAPANNSGRSVPNTLHSPLLDNYSTATDPNIPASKNNFASEPVNNLSNLHSPLLDSWPNKSLLDQHLANNSQKFGSSLNLSETTTKSAQPPTSGQLANKLPRLHSPVLDGPEQSNKVFQPEDLDMPVEEYNSLRSPLLGAKVPLPEISVKQVSSQPSANQITSSLPAASYESSSTAVKVDASTNNDLAPQTPSITSPSLKSLLGIPSADQINSTAEQNYKQFASSLFDTSPTETGDRPPIPASRNTGHFKITGIKKEEKSTNTPIVGSLVEKNEIIDEAPVQQTRLSREEPQELIEVRPSGQIVLFKVMAALCLITAFSAKLFYWRTLGSTWLSSFPFLSDQIGQIIVMLLLLIVILTAKF